MRWMGTKAEELGVEIYPGFAASEVFLLLFGCWFYTSVTVYKFFFFFLARYCMMQTTKLLVLELMIWELQKMVQRRRIFNVASRSKVFTSHVSFFQTHIYGIYFIFLSKMVSLFKACIDTLGNSLLFGPIICSFVCKYLWMFLSFLEWEWQTSNLLIETSLDTVTVKQLWFLRHMIFSNMKQSPVHLVVFIAHSELMTSVLSLILLHEPYLYL